MKTSLGPRTIVYPAPVFIVGTYDGEGKPNAMAAAWGGICCSRPPCVSVSLREATYTHGSIVAQKCFTVSIPPVEHVKEADYFGIATGRTEDKFATTGLTPVRSELVNAPYVDEFPLALECRLIHTLEIGLHTLFVGEILDVKVEEWALGSNGFPDIEKVKPFLYAPGDGTYHAVGRFLGKAFSIGKSL